MEQKIQSGALPSFRGARVLIKGLAVAVFTASAFFLSSSTIASATSAVPVISVTVREQLGYSVRIANKWLRPRYTFDAQVDLPIGGPRLKADLYFGILPHKSDLSWSWTAVNNKPVLTKRMVPIVENIDMMVPQSINPADYVEGDFAYEFQGTEQSGLYLVFVLLVAADKDPSNPRNWLGVRMEPLSVLDMP